MHEFAHVARWDFLMQTLARVACALHWFNPLVWMADRRLRVECESASDDLVLDAGMTATDYASQLVAVLIAARQARSAPAAAVAMVGARGLERRLRAILDGTRPRRRLSARRAALAAGVAGCLVLPLGIVRLEARAHDVPKIDRLPKGVKIEVIGVSSHPSGPKTWWRPDGSPLAEAPCDPGPDDARIDGHASFEFVARITGLPEGSTLQWHPTECMSNGAPAPRKRGQEAAGLLRCIAKFTQDMPTCVIVFDLAFGPWTMEHAHAGTGTGVEKGDRAYFFGRARETKSGAAIAIAHNITGREVRVLAIDADGVEHAPTSASWGGAGRLMMLDLDFDLPPSRIREYQLKSRPQGRFEIKNVALRPRTAAN
jgi:BlaR1 peptidase M56